MYLPLRHLATWLTDLESFVCALSGEARSKVQFTNYPRDFEMSSGLYNDAKIWEVARATSAASSFFEPIAFGSNKRIFLDGAVGANNPIRQLWQEAENLWGTGPLEPQIQCLVSIGTGVPAVEPFGTNLRAVAKTLLDIATETEQTAESFASEHKNIVLQRRYLRLNVLKGLEGVGLEEASKKNDIEAVTEAYGVSLDVRMKLQAFRECVNVAETASGSPV
jgi:predicted acylesterase/phospholipase RssA